PAPGRSAPTVLTEQPQAKSASAPAAPDPADKPTPAPIGTTQALSDAPKNSQVLGTASIAGKATTQAISADATPQAVPNPVPDNPVLSEQSKPATTPHQIATAATTESFVSRKMVWV